MTLVTRAVVNVWVDLVFRFGQFSTIVSLLARFSGWAHFPSALLEVNDILRRYELYEGCRRGEGQGSVQGAQDDLTL